MEQCENCGTAHDGDAGLCRRCLRELGVSPEGMGEEQCRDQRPALGHLLSREGKRPSRREGGRD